MATSMRKPKFKIGDNVVFESGGEYPLIEDRHGNRFVVGVIHSLQTVMPGFYVVQVVGRLDDVRMRGGNLSRLSLSARRRSSTTWITVHEDDLTILKRHE